MFKDGRLVYGIVSTAFVEAILYLILFKNYAIADYAFMWAACLIFTFFLKLFNVEPTKGSLNMGRNASDAYTNLSLSFLEKHFNSKYRKKVTSADEDKRTLIKYGVLIVVNCIIVYLYG